MSGEIIASGALYLGSGVPCNCCSRDVPEPEEGEGYLPFLCVICQLCECDDMGAHPRCQEVHDVRDRLLDRIVVSG